MDLAEGKYPRSGLFPLFFLEACSLEYIFGSGGVSSIFFENPK